MILRNNTAAVIWGFSAVFTAFVVAMTYVFIRDGAPQIYPPKITDSYSPEIMFGILSIFWLGAIGLFSYAESKFCLQIMLLPDSSVLIIRRYPFKTETCIVQGNEINPATVIKSRDDENSPYFYARITLADGTTMDIAEGYDYDSCVEACTHFNSAVWKPPLSSDSF